MNNQPTELPPTVHQDISAACERLHEIYPKAKVYAAAKVEYDQIRGELRRGIVYCMSATIAGEMYFGHGKDFQEAEADLTKRINPEKIRQQALDMQREAAAMLRELEPQGRPVIVTCTEPPIILPVL